MSDASLPTTFCPGYVHVEDFSQDDEYEDEEVCYVTVELENVEPTLIASSEHMRLIVRSYLSFFYWIHPLNLSDTGFRYSYSIYAALRDDSKGSTRYTYWK